MFDYQVTYCDQEMNVVLYPAAVTAYTPEANCIECLCRILSYDAAYEIHSNALIRLSEELYERDFRDIVEE